MNCPWNRASIAFYSYAAVVGGSFWWFMDWTLYTNLGGAWRPFYILPISVQLVVSSAVGIGGATLAILLLRRDRAEARH